MRFDDNENYEDEDHTCDIGVIQNELIKMRKLMEVVLKENKELKKQLMMVKEQLANHRCDVER